MSPRAAAIINLSIQRLGNPSLCHIQKRFGNRDNKGYLEASEPEMKTDMRYPLYVWKDEGSAYSASFPDLPDVFTAADELVDLPSMAQEAVMAMYGSSNSVLPEPSTIEQWEADKQFQGGFWMQVLIQLPA